jgi:hypothetical protein
MRSTTMTRRSMLGGLLTAGAVAAWPESIAHASTNGAFDIESLATASAPMGPLSAATPGYHYDRFSALSFLPFSSLTYSSVPGGLRHTSATAEAFVCPFAPKHGTRLKELEFYIDTGTATGLAALVRFTGAGGAAVLTNTPIAIGTGIQTITVPVDVLIDAVNFDYQLWVGFNNTGVFRGARVASIAPTGLITVPQNRKLDTRAGSRPVVGSITTVDLAPDVPNGARAALVTVTATGTAVSGFVTAFPGDQPAPPNTSTLNWSAANIDVATTSVVNLGAGTSIKLAIGGPAGAAAHLLCDVIGYFI